MVSEWTVAITWYDTWMTKEHPFGDHTHAIDTDWLIIFTVF